jgi:hypothetical protein
MYERGSEPGTQQIIVAALGTVEVIYLEFHVLNSFLLRAVEH